MCTSTSRNDFYLINFILLTNMFIDNWKFIFDVHLFSTLLVACVNCVRWSNNGKSLASGGDDKLIMIWQTSRYCIWDYFNQLCIKVKKWNFFVLIFTLNCYVVLIYHLNMWCNPGLVFSSELVWGLPLALAHPLMNNGDQLQLLGATQGVTVFNFTNAC